MDACNYLELKRKLAELEVRVQPAKEPNEQYVSVLRPLASWMLQAAPPGASALMLDLKPYDGSTKAAAHLSHVEAKMCLISSNDEVLCKALISSLTGTAEPWFGRLATALINSWPQFKAVFLKRFSSAGQMSKTVADLGNLLQRKGENYLDYYNRFKSLLDQIDEEITDRELINCFKSGLFAKGERLDYELQIHKVSNRDELYKRIYDVSIAEDRKRHGTAKRIEGGEPPSTNDHRDHRGEASGYRGKNKSKGPERHTERVPKTFTPLTVSRSELINLVDFGPAPKMKPKNNKNRRDPNEYCAFHKEKGHSTEEFMSFKRLIQRWIDDGQLPEYVRKDERPAGGNDNDNPRNDRGGPRKKLLAIMEEESNTALKNRVYHLKKVPHSPLIYSALEDVISFYPSELASNSLARQQLLIIPGLIDRCESARILIDTGAAKNILFYNTFQQMEIPDSRLRPYNGRLEEFTNHRVEARGEIDLEVDLGTHPRQIAANITFIVVDVISDYHAILRAPGQAIFNMVAPIPHQRVKFPTSKGVGCVKGTASEFYEYVLKKNKGSANTPPSSSRIVVVEAMEEDPIESPPPITL